MSWPKSSKNLKPNSSNSLWSKLYQVHKRLKGKVSFISNRLNLLLNSQHHFWMCRIQHQSQGHFLQRPSKHQTLKLCRQHWLTWDPRLWRNQIELLKSIRTAPVGSPSANQKIPSLPPKSRNQKLPLFLEGPRSPQRRVSKRVFWDRAKWQPKYSKPMFRSPLSLWPRVGLGEIRLLKRMSHLRSAMSSTTRFLSRPRGIWTWWWCQSLASCRWLRPNQAEISKI